ncbi:MAG: DUF2382 domain-containing protein [Myxococcaceae bacterium]
MSAFGIQPGQEVVDDAGRRVGRVIAPVDRGWVVERGALIPKRFFVSFEDVARLQDGVIHLSRSPLPYPPVEDHRAPLPAKEEVKRIPLRDEHAELKVYTAEAERVRVRKVVREEEKTFTVTLRREELIVERLSPDDENVEVDSSGSPLLDAGPLTFVLREDRVKLDKYSVVREVVRIHRERHEEQRDVHTTVRREEATIERDVLPSD